MHRHRSVLRVTFLLLALLVAFLAGQMSAAQPMMQNALGNLKQARANLNKATADKGGHRNKALALVGAAIEEVEKGIAFDRRH